MCHKLKCVKLKGHQYFKFFFVVLKNGDILLQDSDKGRFVLLFLVMIFLNKWDQIFPIVVVFTAFLSMNNNRQYHHQSPLRSESEIPGDDVFNDYCLSSTVTLY